jgi:hypothetical protein
MKKIAAFLLGASIFLPALTVHAQGLSEGERKNIARTLFQEGVKLQESGKASDVPAALAKFEAAQKNFSAPTNVLHIAECQALLGHLIDASETYNNLAKMKVDPDKDPPIFLQAQQQGAGEAAGVKGRIPTLKVDVQPDAKTLQNLQITFNDKPMPPELIGVPHQFDPGTYRIAAYANGYLLKEPSGDVVVKEKETKIITIILAPVGGAAATPVPVTGTVAQNTPPATGTPPPVAGADQNPPPKDQPPPVPPPPPPPDNSKGYLVGLRGAYLVPFGNVPKPRSATAAVIGSTSDVGMGDMFGGGGAIGLDGGLRLAKVLYLGLTAEFGTFGAGSDTSTIPNATVSTSTFMLGLEAGLITSPDRFAFFGTAGLGYRTLKQSITGGGRNLEVGGTEANFSGFDLWTRLGFAIPAGPLRLIPYGSLALGTFSRSSSDALGAASSNQDVTNTSLHGFLGLGLAAYFTGKM